MTDIQISREKGSWTMFVLKGIFFVGAFFIIIFTILANMGGRSEALKGSVEEFLSESAGYKAKIKTLNNVNFFPTIIADFEGLDLFRADAGDIPAIHVDRLRAALGFWDVAMSNGHMKAMEIEGVTAMPGVWLSKTLRLESAAIVNKGENAAAFEGKGTIGDAPVNFSMDMSVSGDGASKKYRFGPQRLFTMELGAAKLEARLKNAADIYLTVEDLKIALHGAPALSGRLEVIKRTSREIGVRGEIALTENGTVLKPDLVINVETRKISGSISSVNFNKADIQENSRFDMLIAEIVSILGDAQADKTTLDKFFASGDVKLELTGPHSYAGPLVFENNHLKIP